MKKNDYLHRQENPGSTRDKKGRFVPGVSGNPKGIGGTATFAQYRQQVLRDAAPELLEKLVSDAKNGEAWAMRLCMERLFPTPKAVLPETEICAEDVDLDQAADTVIKAGLTGQISVDHSVRFLEAIEKARAIKEGSSNPDEVEVDMGKTDAQDDRVGIEYGQED